VLREALIRQCAFARRDTLGLVLDLASFAPSTVTNLRWGTREVASHAMPTQRRALPLEQHQFPPAFVDRVMLVVDLELVAPAPWIRIKQDHVTLHPAIHAMPTQRQMVQSPRHLQARVLANEDTLATGWVLVGCAQWIHSRRRRATQSRAQPVMSTRRPTESRDRTTLQRACATLDFMETDMEHVKRAQLGRTRRV
jgi:hypothetical protein